MSKIVYQIHMSEIDQHYFYCTCAYMPAIFFSRAKAGNSALVSAIFPSSELL